MGDRSTGLRSRKVFLKFKNIRIVENSKDYWVRERQTLAKVFDIFLRFPFGWIIFHSKLADRNQEPEENQLLV